MVELIRRIRETIDEKEIFDTIYSNDRLRIEKLRDRYASALRELDENSACYEIAKENYLTVIGLLNLKLNELE